MNIDRLNADEQALLARAIERVRVHVDAGLAAGVDAPAAVRRLHGEIDAATTRADRRGPRPACAPGCAHCCAWRVTVVEAETLPIAAAVRGMPAVRQAEVRVRLQEGAAARARDPDARRPCALLEAGHCSVYAVRPASCRKAHSLSEPACRAEAATLPQDLARLLEVEALTLGSQAAWRAHGLPSAVQELQAGVLAAWASLDGTPLVTVAEPPADPCPP